MCGISGFLGYELNYNLAFQKSSVSKMLDLLRHRGPDSCEILSTGMHTIGACRLSIVGGPFGTQPIKSIQSTHVIVFNGEIYNYRALGKQFSEKGLLHTGSDTEVLLYLFESQGTKCLNLLNGMFAFCITDGKTAYLVRDRFGEKPLYYRFEDRNVVFASEAKALISTNPNLHLETTYDEFETVVGFKTLFQGVFELPPGNYLKYESASGLFSVNQYYHLRADAIGEDYTEQDIIDRVRWLVEDAVRLRVDTKLPYGCGVSGGLDSTILANLSRPNRLFSSVTRDISHLNEEMYLAQIGVDYGEKLTVFEPQAFQFAETFVEMIRAVDFPVTSIAAFPQFMLSNLIHQSNLRIFLSGIGLDECFNGYTRHVAMLFGKEDMMKNEVFRDYKPLFSRLPSLNTLPLSYSYYCLIGRSKFETEQGVTLVDKLYNSQNHLLNSLTVTDMAISLPPLLRMDDRINMHFSIENRSPFLDHRIVEFALAIPDNFKIRQFPDGKVVTKYILRKAFSDIVPQRIVWRMDKKGFPSAVSIWLNSYYADAVERAHKIICEIPEISHLFPVNVLSDNDVFSRKKWQLVQWATWYLLFFEQRSEQDVKELLFC